jgi:hypothetical protein
MSPHRDHTREHEPKSEFPLRGWELARLFAYTVLLVFGAVTLAWWGFLAWLIWRVI